MRISMLIWLRKRESDLGRKLKPKTKQWKYLLSLNCADLTTSFLTCSTLKVYKKWSSRLFLQSLLLRVTTSTYTSTYSIPIRTTLLLNRLWLSLLKRVKIVLMVKLKLNVKSLDFYSMNLYSYSDWLLWEAKSLKWKPLKLLIWLKLSSLSV